MNKTLLNSKIKEHLSTVIFYLSILFFIIGFNFSDNRAGGWYQQFMPNLNGRNITDIFFLDSLTGWSVTNATNQNTDTTYLLKTTNSGDNWIIQYRKIQSGGGFPGYFRVYFLNQITGYTCGVAGVDKSTDGGISWQSLNAPFNSYLDMSVLNNDTIWVVSSNPLTGGVFRTTNGGGIWQQQPAPPSDHIYMFNRNIGFITNTQLGTPKIYKTTNSGTSWDLLVDSQSFTDILFVDSLIGWRAWGTVRKTTDGGLSWISQILPSGFGISSLFATKFSNVNNDTIWLGGGRIIFPNSQARGILFRTTNGGDNWLFQIPDTTIRSGIFSNVKFINKNTGWASTPTVLIHTTTGGNDTFYTSVKKISSNIPDRYKLFQNYPNPFNPVTNIKYEVRNPESVVRLVIYDLNGREILTLVNKKQDTGTYKVTFNGSNYSSGIYFYSLFAEGILIDTKKMILLK